MLSTGIILATACGIGWIVSDAMRKRLAATADPLPLAVWLAASQLVILLLATPILLNLPSLGSWSVWSIQDDYWLYSAPTFICTAIGHVFFLKALRLADLGLTIPYLSFSPILVMLFAMVFLHEWPTMPALVGLFIVAGGAFLLNRRRDKSADNIQASDQDKGILFMLATTVLWSAGAAFDKAAIQYASSLTHLTLLLGSTVFILECYRRLFANRSKSAHLERRQIGMIVLVGLVMLSAIALQFSAYSHWDVAYVEAVKRALGLIGSVVAGTMFFNEGQLRKRLAAVVLMACGTALIVVFG